MCKKETKLLQKRTPPVGILHQASDWVPLADLDGNFCFPIYIAFTQLRPDTAYSVEHLGKGSVLISNTVSGVSTLLSIHL